MHIAKGAAGTAPMRRSRAPRSMSAELSVLRIVSERLEGAGIAFMLTGSFALTYYATPRMTRDLDFVVACEEQSVKRLVSLFSHDFYVDEDAARSAVRLQRLFNLMHFNSGIKVDMIVRKDSEYRITEFERRQRVQIGSVMTWIASREDLILSKLVWARDTRSELQRRDVNALLGQSVDVQYVTGWASRLSVDDLWDEIRNE